MNKQFLKSYEIEKNYSKKINKEADKLQSALD